MAERLLPSVAGIGLAPTDLVAAHIKAGWA
jgi:hypothetical protein